MCLCVCVSVSLCLCECFWRRDKESKRQGEREREREREERERAREGGREAQSLKSSLYGDLRRRACKGDLSIWVSVLLTSGTPSRQPCRRWTTRRLALPSPPHPNFENSPPPPHAKESRYHHPHQTLGCKTIKPQTCSTRPFQTSASKLNFLERFSLRKSPRT